MRTAAPLIKLGGVGAAIQAWVVDLERVRGLYASRDEAMLARLDAPTHRYTGSLLRADEPGHARDEMRCAVIEILKGSSCELLPTQRYHYAAEAICHELRVPLELERGLSLSGSDQLSDALSPEHCHALERCLPYDVTWFMPLPESEGYPFVGWVERGEVAGRLEDCARLRSALDALRAHSAEARDVLANYGDPVDHLERVYRAAASAGLDVVVFAQ